MYKGNVERPAPSRWCSLLNHNHCTPPSAICSFSWWYECRVLEDAIVWRVEQKKGGKLEGISHQSSSLQSLRSPHPALLYYLFLHLCSLSLSASPIRSFIPSSVKLDVCDGPPFSSVPSSQTNISLLSTLFLLLCRPDTISRKLPATVFPRLSVLHGTYPGDLTRIPCWRRSAGGNLLPGSSLHRS